MRSNVAVASRVHIDTALECKRTRFLSADQPVHVHELLAIQQYMFVREKQAQLQASMSENS